MTPLGPGRSTPLQTIGRTTPGRLTPGRTTPGSLGRATPGSLGRRSPPEQRSVTPGRGRQSRCQSREKVPGEVRGSLDGTEAAISLHAQPQ